MIEITKPRSGERTQPRVEAPASAQALEPEVRHTPILSREAATEVEPDCYPRVTYRMPGNLTEQVNKACRKSDQGLALSSFNEGY